MKEKRDREIATIEAIKYLLDNIDYGGIERILQYLQRRYRDNTQASTITAGNATYTFTNTSQGDVK